ncbi:hypothetical protein HDU99_007282 [Rhizoclosmatium hyalinum]|nr:hypothetical protein HDU99_007282 [Rhizoclosmatium hyalinum]
MHFFTASLLTGAAAFVNAGPAYVARADTPACHTEWDRNIAYQEHSFVSFEGKNYHNKYFIDKGFDPVGNGEGGWVLDGICSSAGSGSSGTSPSATTAGDIQVTGTSAAPSKATTAIASSCFTAWDSKAFFYLGGQKISYEGVNYEAKWWAGSWDVPGKGLPWIDRGSCGAFPISTLSLASVSSATTEQATSSVEGPVATTTSNKPDYRNHFYVKQPL